MTINGTTAKTAVTTSPRPEVIFREPNATDGAALHALVAECPPLDTNSMYCNLLHCTHFSATSVAACQGDQLAGFVSGYLLPESPETVFVWQVAVSPAARKQGLAGRMLRQLLARPVCRGVKFLHTTITPDNTASRALFTALAVELDVPLNENIWFERAAHFGGAHADEVLLAIGPFDQAALDPAARRDFATR